MLQVKVKTYIRGGVHNFRDCCCSSAMLRQMILLAYTGSQCTTFHAAGWKCWFFTFFLGPCIRPDAISRRIRQRECVKSCTSLGKCETETLTMIREAFGEESMSRTRMFERHVRFRADWKRRDRWRSKSRTCSSFSMKSMEFVLAGQTVNSAYYCEILWRVREHVWRLRPELWRQRNWLLHHDNA
jgi:hypothetical protein